MKISCLLKIPVLLTPILLLNSGCQNVSILDSGNLRRPALNFKATGARSTTGVLVGQIETGRAAGSGVAAGGCAACN